MDRIINPNGNIIKVVPNNGDKYTLSELQKYVGGYIEMINVGNEILICNEEGKINNLPVNDKATREFSTYLYSGDYFCGSVVVVDPKNID